MSLPEFPTYDLTQDNAINQIISSIAMEELALSHIMNAEGEKIQYVLGTIEGVDGPEVPATVEDLLNLNKSVRDTLDSVMQNQMFLKMKLQTALSSYEIEKLKSSSPIINTITENSTVVTGFGIPGCVVTVVFPGDIKSNTTVGEDYEWSVNVVGTLTAGDEVSAYQICGKALQSDTVTMTVIA